MKSLVKAALILSVSFASLQAQASGNITVRGALSCGKWVEVRKAKNEFPALMWLVGYLSGLSSGLGVDVLDGTDNDSLSLWMDNYCQANPLVSMTQGANKLFMELAAKKGPAPK